MKRTALLILLVAGMIVVQIGCRATGRRRGNAGRNIQSVPARANVSDAGLIPPAPPPP